MDPEVEKILQEFIDTINDLMVAHGEDEVLAELEMLMPFLESQGAQIGPLHEVAPVAQATAQAVARNPGVVKKGLDLVRKVPGAKWVEDKIRRHWPTGAVVAADAATDVASTIGGKYIDQDVTITDIETDKPLNVKSTNLEDLLRATNDALEKMSQVLLQTQQQVTNKLDGVDASVDDMIAAETGESTAQVQSRQQSLAPRPSKKKAADSPEKKAPEKQIKPATVKK
jgi:hypothetical protein